LWSKEFVDIWGSSKLEVPHYAPLHSQWIQHLVPPNSAVHVHSTVRQVNTNNRTDIQVSKIFPKAYVLFQNSRRQKSDTKLFSYWGPTNTGHHCMEFSRPGFLTPSSPLIKLRRPYVFCSSYFSIWEERNLWAQW
jgi:hypothetical protein